MDWRRALLALSVSVALLAPTSAIGNSVSSGSKVYIPQIINDSPGLVFRDDFSNPGSGWPVSNTPDVQGGYLNGEYQILILNPAFIALATPYIPPTVSEQFGVSADMRYASVALGSYGLVFDYDDYANTGYYFTVSPASGEFDLLEVPGNGHGSSILTSGTSSAILPGQASNHLTIIRNLETITGIVNQTTIFTIQNIDLSTGITGLLNNGSLTDSTDARFDNFVLTSPGVSNQAQPLARTTRLIRNVRSPAVIRRR